MKISQIILVLFFLNISFCGFAQDLSNLKNTKPVTFSGGLNLQTGFYAMNGAKARQPGFTYLVNGSPTLNIYGVSLPFSFTFSNFQRDFRQPFNQFGLSPTYKWMTFHAGYRNISYSQFGMAGFTLLGGGVELNPKNFRIALLYGRTQKAVAEDTAKNVVRNLNDITYPVYRRMLLVAKLGYGTADNFLDLHFLQGKDDSTSIPFRPLNSQILPAKNQVFGASNKLSFFKKKLILLNEVSSSIYTRDNGFENIELKNKTMSNFLKPNISTQFYYAMESQLNYTHKKFGAGAKYRKVTPDYQSMGAYFFQTDFEQYLANFNTGIFKQKLRLNASAGIQKDNLLNKKLATTSRKIYTANVSFNPNSKFGIDASFSNFGTSQKSGRRNLSDTSTINQINNSITIVPRYMIVKEKHIINWQAVVGKQQLNDRNRFTESFTEVNMSFVNLIWMKTILAKKMSYNISLNYNESKNIAGTIGLHGFNSGFSKQIKEGKISTDGNLGFNTSTFDGDFNGFVGNLQYSLNYQIGKKQRLGITANALFNESKNAIAGESFQEYFVRLNYGLSF